MCLQRILKPNQSHDRVTHPDLDPGRQPVDSTVTVAKAVPKYAEAHGIQTSDSQLHVGGN